MILILTIYGKLNFLSLARHSKSCESRFQQNFKKKFDWLAFNAALCMDAVSVYFKVLGFVHNINRKIGVSNISKTCPDIKKTIQLGQS